MARITVIGAGAIGGTVGAFLAQAGYDVLLVDVVPEHVRIMNAEGLRITGIRGDRRYPVRAALPEELRGPLEIVLLCVKGHFTEAAMEQYASLLAPDGYIVSLQNGLNEEIIARYVGPERAAGTRTVIPHSLCSARYCLLRHMASSPTVEGRPQQPHRAHEPPPLLSALASARALG